MAGPADALAGLMQIPGMQELFNQSITQQRQLAPLRQGIIQTAANQLPRSSWSGGGNVGQPNIGAIAPANFSTPAPSGGDAMSSLLKMLLPGLLGFAAGRTGTGRAGGFDSIMAGLKKAFGHHDASIPGYPEGTVMGEQDLPGAMRVPDLTPGINSGDLPGGFDMGDAGGVGGDFGGDWEGIG